jgi:hypothetical protein
MKRTEPIWESAYQVALWMTVVALTIGLLATIGYQVKAIQFRYPLDYGEAPLINQAAQINVGNPVYRQDLATPPFTIANYPPVYIGVLAIFEGIFGPFFWYGRLISALSALGSVVMLFLITFAMSRRTVLSLIPGLLFLNIPYMASWSTLARIDHLALFLALLGLYFLLKYQQGIRPKLFFLLGSLFLILAIYTRQSYALAAPFGAFLLLLKRDWRRALLLTLVVGGGALGVFLCINALTKGGFFFNIVTANVNPFDFFRVVENFRNFFESVPVVFILAALGVVVVFRQFDQWPLIIGFLFGGFFSALTIGKIGSNVNYFLELSAGLCLAIGGLLVILDGRRKYLVFRSALLVGLVFLTWQGLTMAREVQQRQRDSLDARIDRTEALETLEHLVKQNLSEPILSDEYMGMVVLNGGPLFLQPFEMTQLANAGVWDQQPLLDEIAGETFPLILIQEGSWWEWVAATRWTPEMLSAVDKYYKVSSELAFTVVYQPRSMARAWDMTSACPESPWALPTTAPFGYRYEEGFLLLYGAGSPGQVPVTAVADGLLYRPESHPGSLLLVHENPLNRDEKVILLYEDLESITGQEYLISADFPPGTEGLPVQAGAVLGYQSTWSGKPFQPAWLHLKVGLAHYDPAALTDFTVLVESLINPSDFFGLVLEEAVSNPKPLECR